jgi:uncharacterized protein (TIGR02246 family)
MRWSQRSVWGALCVLTAVTAFAADEKIPTADEAAVRAATAKFVAAFNSGDSKTTAAFWTEDGDFVGLSGQAVRMRERISQAKSDKQAADKKPTLALSISSIRFVTPDVATVDGSSMFKASAVTRTVHGRYTAVWVKRDGHWMIDSIREATLPTGGHHSRLSELEWMIGEWVADDGEGGKLASIVSWSADGNFILREFKSELPGRGTHSGVQRIGYDAQAEKIRSWTFQHDGGFSEGQWDGDDGHWTADITSVTADGQLGSSTNEITKIDENTIEWESTGAVIGGRELPDLKLRVKRKTAEKAEPQPAKSAKPAREEK